MNRYATANALIGRAKAAGAARAIVALSGGKDSLVCLDLAVKSFGAAHVVAFFMYLVPGLAVEETPVRAAARRYGIELLTVPHWDLERMLSNAVLRPHILGIEHWRQLKLKDIELLVRKRSGLDWIVYGHRMDESPERRGMLRSFDGVDVTRKRVYPLMHWKGVDSYAYLRMNRIPVPSMLGGGRNAGVELTPESLHYLRAEHPEDYARILRFFPGAGAVLARAGTHGIPLTARERVKHGHVQGGVVSPTYRSWASMIQRCHNPKHTGYARYGGAGVTVCARWRAEGDGFKSFVADLGERPDRQHSLERIDGAKGYEPGNCKWATRTEQQRNRKVVKLVEHNGKTQPVSAWAQEAGISTQALANRLARGWDLGRALATPVSAR